MRKLVTCRSLLGVLAVGAMLFASFPAAAAAANWGYRPQNVTATELPDGIEVNWSPPTDNAAAVTGYRVIRKLQGVETKFTRVAEVTDTTWVDTEATEAGQEYRYKVKAVRGSHAGKSSRKATVTRDVQTTQTMTRSHVDDSIVNYAGQWTIARNGQRTKTFTGVHLRSFIGYVIEVYETGPEWIMGSLTWSAKIKDDNGVTVKTFSNTNGPGLSLISDVFAFLGSGPVESVYDVEVEFVKGHFESSATMGWPDRLEIEAEMRIYTYSNPIDDCAGELNTNCTINNSQPVEGSFHSDYDTDWYRVRLTGGTVYEVLMAPDETKDAAAAAWINGIYNSDRDFLTRDGSIVAGPQVTNLAYHTAAGGVATHDGVARTTIRPLSTGECPDDACYYYIVVGSYGSAGNRAGHYTLSAARIGSGELDGDDYVPGFTIGGSYLEGGGSGSSWGLYGSIAPWTIRYGSIEHHKDRDWFRAGHLDAGVQYRAVMRGTTLHDAQIGGVYNEAAERIVGPPIDDFDVMLSFDSRLDFTVPTTGFYFIEATASNCKVDTEELDPVTGDLVCGKKNKASVNNIGQYSLFLRTLS